MSSPLSPLPGNPSSRMGLERACPGLDPGVRVRDVATQHHFRLEGFQQCGSCSVKVVLGKQSYFQKGSLLKGYRQKINRR